MCSAAVDTLKSRPYQRRGPERIGSTSQRSRSDVVYHQAESNEEAEGHRDREQDPPHAPPLDGDGWVLRGQFPEPGEDVAPGFPILLEHRSRLRGHGHAAGRCEGFPDLFRGEELQRPLVYAVRVALEGRSEEHT